MPTAIVRSFSSSIGHNLHISTLVGPGGNALLPDLFPFSEPHEAGEHFDCTAHQSML